MQRKREKSSVGRTFRTFALTVALAGSLSVLTAQARTLDVATPSEEQIREAVASVNLSEKVAYAKTPVVSGNYDPGRLTDDVQESAVNTLNVVRYIAGIPNDVTVNSTYAEYAQAGALVNYVNGKMEHKPLNEHGMDENLFNTRYKGTSEGNLHSSTAGSMSMNSAIVSGWMADNGDNNLDTVGHRRWCLNPTMKQTGFGAVTGSKGSYACMYAFDKSGNSTCNTVVWPAQTMPTEYFGGNYPWNVSSNTEFSQNTTVVLTRERDGQTKTWNFSKSSADGHFVISNAGYGMRGCVIFRPSGVGSYQDGDEFTVTVSENGVNTLTYTVRFFSLVQIADNAKIGLKYDARGMKVGEEVPNWVDVTDTSITNDKIEVEVKDPSVAQAYIYEAKYLYIKGLKVGKTTVTVSLPNGESASCTATVNEEEHVHDFSLTRTVREPTCYMEGVAVSGLCECGAAETDADGSISYSRLRKTSHTPVSIPGEEATCTEPGLTDGEVCSVCSEVIKERKEIEALGHKEVDVPEVAATCTTAGTTAGKMCSVCEAVLEGMEEIPAPGHTREIVPQVDPTCGEPGTTQWVRCSVCDATLEAPEEIPATDEHVEETIEGKEPTCTEPGLSAGVKCSVCDKILEAQVEVEALGHAPVIDEAVEATCTDAGLTEGSHCSRCEKVLVPQEEVEALGHDYEIAEGEEAVEATCDKTGLTAGLECTRCGAKVPQETTEALGHELVTDDPAVEPTCTESGLTEGKRCTRCDYKEEQEPVDALGHELIEDEAVEPTCTQSGLTEGKHCSRCEYTEGRNDVDPLGHEIVIDKKVEPTCTDIGLTEGSHCSRCEKVLKPQEEIEALGHVYEVVEGEEAVEATCDKTGLTAGLECSRCGDKVQQETIEALGHELAEDPAVEATYDSTGLTAGSHCSVCGETIVAQQVIPKLKRPADPPQTELSQPEQSSGLQSPAVGVIFKDAKNGGTYEVSIAGKSGTAAVEFKELVNKNEVSVTIPDTVTVNGVSCKVTAIAPNAFKNSKKLRKVKLGKNITQIGSNAFSGCKKLTSVTLGANVTDIGANAFGKCADLTKVTIPAKVKKIGKQAFSGCGKLKTIVIKSTKLTAKSIGAKAFSKVSKRVTVRVPKKCLKTYKKLLKKKGLPASAKVRK